MATDGIKTAEFIGLFPWPPSINRYYRTGWHGKRHISKEGEQYRDTIWVMSREQRWCEFGEARLKVRLVASPPDRRKRDLDNTLKCLLDSLEHTLVFADDEQIDDLHIIRAIPAPPGNIWVEISEIAGKESDA